MYFFNNNISLISIEFKEVCTIEWNYSLVEKINNNQSYI